MSLTKEQETWLANSRETYEFYLLHAILHDPLRRSSMLAVPVQPGDFIKEEAELILHALIHAVKVMRACNLPMPSPPTMEFMRSYMESASTSEGTDRETLRSAYMMLMELLKPSYSDQWYCINPYFEAWYGGVHGKRIAREIQASPVPDMTGAISKAQRALAAAVAATASDEEDEMTQVMEGTEFEMERRTPTGIEGLDESLNGGWGDGECYLLFGGTGAGKCHGAGTKILMHDGSVKVVENVAVGDLIMGPDSAPREVIDLVRGREEMLRITPRRAAEPVVVNRSHTLTLAVTNIGQRVVRSGSGVEARSGMLIDVTLDDYLTSSDKFRHVTKWVQVGVVEFPRQDRRLEIPPYLLGFWLGDGNQWHPTISKPGCEQMLREVVESAGWVCSRCPDDPERCEKVSITGGFKAALRGLGLICNKHIPAHFLTASVEERAALLAGLLDADGSVEKSGWEFSNTQSDLVEAVAFLSRSLGYSATVSGPRITRGFGVECNSWRVHVQPFGDVSLPVKRVVPSARRQIKNPLTNGFAVESLGEGDYYGFSVSGPDRRYLLGDFSITHNSIAAGQCAWHVALTGGYPLIVSTELRPREYVSRMVSCASTIPINILQDCGNFVQIRSAVAQAPGMAFKEAMVEKVLRTIKERVRVAKVSPDAGMDARSTLEREREKYKQQVGHYPTWICLDWLGSMADIGGGGKSTSERALAWEMSASSCVAFADVTNTATLVLAQAVNDSQLKRILSIQDIGISKGIAKNMVAAIGLTNSMDTAGVKAAVAGSREMPASMFLEDQFLCTCKARKGEGNNIAVRRDFRYQRLIPRPRT